MIWVFWVYLCSMYSKNSTGIHPKRKWWSWLIKLLSVLSIETCWPSFVIFSFSLLSFLCLFLVLLFTDIFHKAIGYYKFLCFFSSSLQPQAKPFFLLWIETLKSHGLSLAAIKNSSNPSLVWPQLFLLQL